MQDDTKVAGRSFGEGRVKEIEGYIEQSFDYAVRSLIDVTRLAPVLDVGANYGYALDYAAREYGWAGIGIDREPQHLLSQVVLRCDAEGGMTWLANNSNMQPFGLVFINHVLEHIGDHLSVLKQAQRLGRTLFVAVPHPDSVDYEADDHLHRFTEGTLWLSMEGAGWKPKDVAFPCLRPEHKEIWMTAVQA